MLTKRILYFRGLGTTIVMSFVDDAFMSVGYDRLHILIRRQVEGKGRTF